GKAGELHAGDAGSFAHHLAIVGKGIALAAVDAEREAGAVVPQPDEAHGIERPASRGEAKGIVWSSRRAFGDRLALVVAAAGGVRGVVEAPELRAESLAAIVRSEEHTSELQSRQ